MPPYTIIHTPVLLTPRQQIFLSRLPERSSRLHLRLQKLRTSLKFRSLACSILQEPGRQHQADRTHVSPSINLFWWPRIRHHAWRELSPAIRCYRDQLEDKMRTLLSHTSG
jgi:hypothetical protein